MSSDGHQEVLEGLGFEVLGHFHGSSHFLHRFFEKSHFLQLDPQNFPLFARFSENNLGEKTDPSASPVFWGGLAEVGLGQPRKVGSS